MELSTTIDGMISPDYKERFVAELKQVYIRMSKLGDMLCKAEEGTLNFEPKTPISVLKAQHELMNGYFNLLVLRAEIEGIEYHLEA